ncbi:MAG: hypothetical protein ACLQAT_26445 [Candidatus Binataceae bacterium]
MRAMMMYSALVLSLIVSGCAPSLISVKARSPLARSVAGEGTGEGSATAACAPFSFAIPDPAPTLPLVKGDKCAGYALCLDEKNRAALFAGMDALENDGVYMRDLYQRQIAAYVASRTQ